MKFVGTLSKLIITITAAFLLGLGLNYLQVIHQPASMGTGSISFSVESGQGPTTIVANLKAKSLLHSERPFFLYTLISGKRNNFYPGSYEIKKGSSVKTIVDLLTNPESRRISVTVIEGWRLNDIVDEITKKLSLPRDELQQLAPVESHEGYLFPDTYYFTPESKAADVIRAMRDNFDRRAKEIAPTRDEVIVASIVEREARNDEERTKIARVYLNRLAYSLPLEADPTIQYAKGSWAPITVSDYKGVQSPYNTYLYKGLPPTPIANPGLASLKAVKNPPRHDYFYFFHTSDGKTIFSKTLEEHIKNKQQYLR